MLYQPVDTIEDAVKFQNKINAVHKWSVDLKMLFDDKKCKSIAFGSQKYRPTYKLGETVMNWAAMTTCHKFDRHIALKQSVKNFGSNLAHSKTSPTKRPVTGLHWLVSPNTGVC